MSLHPARFRPSTRLRLLAAAAAACIATSAGAALPPGAAAEIIHLQGPGEQRPASAAGWQPARVAQPLAAGDFVRTLEAGRMALVFADQTQLRLHQNTVLQVKAVAAPGQSVTSLLLEAGRAWTQTRRSGGSTLTLQTPAATAGIRGTDWDIEVTPDGRTLLTVLSGAVTLTNAHGEVQIGANEAAVAEVGKPPVKIQLSRPRDRIQWVQALQAQPQRYAGLPERDALVRADQASADGDYAAAIATLQQALQRRPGDAVLRAELALAQLRADRLDESATTLGNPGADEPAPLWLARGALARRQGEPRATVQAFEQATRRAPQDDRGWFGLGSAHTEREDVAPARAALQEALRLAPDGPGYQGELGTLAAFTNDLAAAEAAFAQALAAQPGDYVALTGLGLLRLKQGQPAAALDAFLRAGVMEPRFARAKTYMAVAYWQLGRRNDAVATLQQAAQLDEKDPLPHLLLAQVYTDLFRAGDAVEAARAAVVRMPYLKSLNQVANDQQGRANFGAALAFFGLEDWAMELAQQGEYPYWGGSHLFLADRHAGEFNKNSALFQGFLADPLAFGGSPGYATLVQRPGHYGAVNVTHDRERYRLTTPALTLNGLARPESPVAYFVRAQQSRGDRFPIALGVFDGPARDDPTGTSDARARVLTVGLGARPTAALGLFAYYNDTDIELRGNNRVPLFAEEPFRTRIDNAAREAVAGLSYRWGPASQTWLKFGHAQALTFTSAYPTVFAVGPLAGTLGLYARTQKRLADVQLRHTQDLAAGTRLAVTLEHARERQGNPVAAGGAISGSVQGVPLEDVLVLSGTSRIDRRYTGLTVAAHHPVHAQLRIDGALAVHQIRHDTEGFNSYALVNLPVAEDVPFARKDTERHLLPQLGAVWQPAPGWTLRAAHQSWLRPLSATTLSAVETAGIPVEDRLVQAGGRHRRNVLQLGVTVGERTFLSARADHLRIDNPVSESADDRTPSLPFLQELRNPQVLNLSSMDLLEDTPDFDQGRVRSLSLGASHLFSRRLSGYAKAQVQRTQSSYASGSTWVSGRAIPYMPRHTAVLGGTWATEQRLYLSARAVYRSARFEDKINLTPLPAGWNLDLLGFWETDDKRWIVGMAALNLLGPKNERQSRRLVFDARYRF